MYRPSDSNDHSQSAIAVIKARFAYRLPNTNQARYVIGSARKISSLDEFTESGIIVHSFDGSSIYAINSLQSVLPEELDFNLVDKRQEEISQGQYSEGFDSIMEAISKGKIEKAVLSRTQVVDCEVSPLELFHRLNKAYESTFNYVLQIDGQDCWLAATPEVLVKRNSSVVSSMSLAGTKPTDGNSKWTEKEYHEQELVTKQIKAHYSAAGYVNVQANGPKTIQSGYVEHLLTTLSAKNTDDKNFKDLLNKLHPTPAVCGFPTDKAREVIVKAESHDRELYTGFIGIVDGENENYFVNLRCMKLRKGSAILFLGGGITKGSEMENEWRETENKAKTLLSLIRESD